MARKRLSDMVREEVQKEPESDTSLKSVTEVSEPSATETETSSAPKKTAHRRSTETPSSQQLEETIKELRSTLATVNQRASELQNQVTFLETELDKQKTLVKTFQEQLEQAQQLQEALAEQKNLVSKLYTDLQKAQSVQAELEEQKQLVKQMTAQLEQAQQEASEAKELVLHSSSLPIPNRPIGRLVAANSSSNILSNEEIGWFD
jgi:chromosome segregation ATPase